MLLCEQWCCHLYMLMFWAFLMCVERQSLWRPDCSVWLRVSRETGRHLLLPGKHVLGTCIQWFNI